MEKIESKYPEIEGTMVLKARNWEIKRVIIWEKAQEVLAQKGIEIGATYRLFWPKTPDMTIAGISDDMFWFDPNDSKEIIEKRNPQRAAVWGYMGDENQIGFLWYLKDFTKKEGDVAGCIMKYNGMTFDYRKVEPRAVPQKVKDTSEEVFKLL
jgi:hypothetical protein